MHLMRLFAVLACVALVGVTLTGWYSFLGFNPLQADWWKWLRAFWLETGSFPPEILRPAYGGLASFVALMFVGAIVASGARSETIFGGRKQKDIHGTARWAETRDVKESGLLSETGVVVGGWPIRRGVKMLRHDGPEHVLAFAPTRSGKGVGLVLPTLLSWEESALVLDIKGENYALTAGWRASQGQRIFRFDPAADRGSVKYNPLAEIRIGTDHEIADCQNIAIMIIDPDGTGLKDFWMQEGYGWLCTAILHVLYRIKKSENRTATLADVRAFMSIGDDEDPKSISEQAVAAAAKAAFGQKEGEEDDSFDRLLKDMERYEHGREVVNDEVRLGAARMRKRSSNERSGVHSTGTSQLALYSDPIVARNISESDFRITDLMNGDKPATLYIVIPPSDIARLRPLVRILLNQFLTRLTSHMAFEGGRSVKHYQFRMLLMLDEFTSVGKLEIFEKAIAFMAGYGLKAFVIVQDLTQLQKTYGREQSIVSNCHVRIAYAPNTMETARVLSDMAGKTTLVQKKTSASHTTGKIGTNYSETLMEVARPLLTPDECMSLPGIQVGSSGKVTRAGDMLIFVAGRPAIYGRQVLYFQNEDLQTRAKIPIASPTSIPSLPSSNRKAFS
ncbi:type IV secretory system conjugative DNA transfer family protein [Roseibium aggregatum]|uniref:type IV secretory system conjugative DNA transfer family protein n=1 Tax=Roseibium aggregatum TaxID=187304 RepID=UPI0025AC710A|nr:type IV secretory system conjugative DNA transfer family protein [Roseibium aggregatum]WJS05523.1 type IV secretory system conjugative DNA transfer family protein [Roseibium aggregatum]